eukprot:12732532-Ditylum_brightwellii.AAC.1
MAVKKWLHDRCVDAHYLCIKTTAHLSGLADHKNNVHHEPANILHSYPGVKPLDFAAEYDEGLMGVNITITATLLLAQRPRNQEQHTQTLHKSKEVMK